MTRSNPCFSHIIINPSSMFCSVPRCAVLCCAEIKIQSPKNRTTMDIPAACCSITPNVSRLFKRRNPQCPHNEFDEKQLLHAHGCPWLDRSLPQQCTSCLNERASL
ncbi:hypothetical protein FVEG_10289 [Fusarium verticillioides 7600]|uniref:Uncharacterized protein n=1 Tax=Gibberella moniliformis (strain M3125 / FGSC 7600) TaxID=334819 RepID=W7MTZ7_GIBM7|nr:hypothetical protein FVEG_10289 [Fusarium verticillioides 7600]EWG51234.1 hypothetical protein FVEG_10289 [Fusarium verticillioides 7600]